MEVMMIMIMKTVKLVVKVIIMFIFIHLSYVSNKNLIYFLVNCKV